MRTLFLILISIVFGELLLSQDNQIRFKRLNSEDGLSNNWVRCIYKDNIGFMWFGTADGLNRFDGHEFKTYRPQTNNGKSMGDVNVSGISKKDENNLWISTDLGVYIYNFMDDRLHPFPLLHSINSLCVFEDKQKKIWIGTNNGLYQIDQETKKITNFSHNPSVPSSISNNYINTIFEDSESRLWIGTKGGLNLYVKENNSFIQSGTNNSLILSTNDVLSICEDKNKKIWVGYAQDGLFVVDILTSNEIKLYKVLEGKILKLLVDYQNELWIGRGSGEGLDKLNLNQFSKNKQLRLEHIQNNNHDINSISDNSIYSMYEDDLNDIWIGTFGKGINYFSKRSKPFNIVNLSMSNKNSIKNNLVNAMVEDENYIYIGTEAGLDLFDKNKGNNTHFQNEINNPGSLSVNAIYSMYRDSRGNIWIGTWAGGLNLFNPKTGFFKRFLPSEKAGSISSANIFSIFEDKSGNLWIGTIGGGLNRYDYKTGIFTHYKHEKDNPKSLNSNLVNHIFQTSQGRLYVSTYNSLELYNYETDNFTHFAHDYTDTKNDFGSILSIFEDSHKNIWIATNSGLEYFDEKTATFTAYTTKNGLPDNTVQGILEDNNGNLWISTNFGISKFINAVNLPKNPIFYNYTTNDGLSGNEFKKRSAFKNSRGIMYFGSSQGYTWFYPDSIKLNPTPPKVILSSISFLESTNDKKNNELTKGINFIDKLEIEYHNSDFVISFSALNYLNPQNNLFKYMLVGYDKQWIDADNRQSATYTNMNPGTYTFMVLASNNDGIWCKLPKSIKIIINPPWWKTPIFKILAIILTICLSLAFFILRIRLLNNQKNMLEKIVKQRTEELIEMNNILEQRQEEIILQNDELSNHKDHLELLVDERTIQLKASKEKAEESDRLKTVFLQNMSHEIRTPLNAIMGFSSLLPDSFDNKEDLMHFSDIINRKGEDLLQIINGVLDIAKIESGAIPINYEKCDLENLMHELQHYFIDFQKRFHKEHIQFKFIKKCDIHDFDVLLDKEKLRQILINLIGNAFKYTPEGKIEVGCNIDGSNQLNFYVSDTGIGIPEEKFDLIFERFRQIEELTFHEGVGLGLSISKGLVEILGGKIWFTSEIDKGTSFYFTIPFKKSYKNDKSLSAQKAGLLDLKNKTIVIAEDDHNSFYYLKILLDKYKTTLIHAENGKELMDLLETNIPDLILLDINMPIKTGFECLQEIRAKGYPIKIIVQTAYAMSYEKERCFIAGCDGYISKPISQEELYSEISRVFS